PRRLVVVRCLNGLLDVVRVGFLQTRAGDLDEACSLQVGDGGGTGVAHGCAQATDLLVDDALDGATERHATLDALGHQLLLAADISLEVAVLGVGALLTGQATALHGTHGAHAAVTLVLLAVDGDGVTGGLGGAGEHGAEHDGAGAGGECLGDVTGELHATVGDDGDTGLAGRHGGFHDGGDLRCTDTGDHAGGADGARADTDLDGVRTGLDHGLGSLTGGQVATDDLHAGEVLLHAGNHLQHATGVGVGGVD